MENLGLDFDEAVILEQENVRYGSRFGSNYTSRLILTSKNIVLVEYGLLKKVKNIIKFPISSIRTYNGQAQVSAKRGQRGYVLLEVYFTNGPEQFEFMAVSKRHPQVWTENINRLINGESVSINEETNVVEDAVTVVADGLATAVTAFSSAFNKRLNKGKIEAKKCPSCSASLQGQVGSAVVCPYCGTHVSF